MDLPKHHVALGASSIRISSGGSASVIVAPPAATAVASALVPTVHHVDLVATVKGRATIKAERRGVRREPRELTNDEQALLSLIAAAVMLAATTDYGASGSHASAAGILAYLMLRALVRHTPDS